MAYGFSVFERLKDVRLSGWARLWIVVFGLFWAFSAWSNVAVERENWRTVCDWAGCPSHPVVTSAPRFASRGKLVTDSSTEIEVTASEGTSLQLRKVKMPEYVARAIEADKQAQKVAASDELKRRSDLRFQHFQRLASGILSPAMYAVLAFVFAMVAKAAVLWIWRGFKPSKEG